MYLPSSIRSKLDHYEVEIEGTKVKVTFIDHPDMIVANASELSSILSRRQGAGTVVALDVHTDNNNQLLRVVICVPTRILIIQSTKLKYSPHLPSIALNKLLSDHPKTICFVGSNIKEKISMISNSSYPRNKLSTTQFGVEIGYLAAKVMKNRSLEKCGLEEVGNKLGINTSSLLRGCENANLPNENVSVLSEEEIKCAIYNAYTCCAIGSKLSGML